MWIEHLEQLRAAPVDTERDVCIGQVFATMVALHSEAGRVEEAERSLAARPGGGASGDLRAGFVTSQSLSHQPVLLRVRAVDTAPQESWRSVRFREAVSVFSEGLDVSVARAWAARARSMLGRLVVDDPVIAKSLRRLMTSAAR